MVGEERPRARIGVAFLTVLGSSWDGPSASPVSWLGEFLMSQSGVHRSSRSFHWLGELQERRCIPWSWCSSFFFQILESTDGKKARLYLDGHQTKFYRHFQKKVPWFSQCGNLLSLFFALESSPGNIILCMCTVPVFNLFLCVINGDSKFRGLK